MMKKYAYALVALSFLLLVVARAADDKPQETPYYPLKIGDTWIYKAGQVSVSSTITKYERVGDQMCARIESSTGGKVVATEDVAVKPDGVYRCASAENKVDPPLLFLKLPAAKDLTWSVNSTTAGQKISGTFTSGMEDKVTVASGTYENVYTCTGDCETSGIKINFKYFFAKDVGMIKQIIKLPTQEITLELEKFEPAK
jgi:hypothetical protein